MFDLLLRSVSQNLKEFSSDLTHNWENPVKAVTIATTIGSLVQLIAGKRLAVLFITSSIVAIPFLKKHITILERLTLDKVALGVFIVTTGRMCLINPFLAANMIGGIILIILKSDNFIDARLSKKPMDTVLENQTALKQSCRDIRSQIEQLEVVFKAHVSRVGTPAAQEAIKKLIESREIPIEQKETSLEEELQQIKEKLTILEAFSQFLTEGISFLEQHARSVAEGLQQKAEQNAARLRQEEIEAAAKKKELMDKMARLGLDVDDSKGK